MSAGSYEYRSLIATTWDLFRGDTSGWSDRSLYLDLIRRYGEPVLDVGCGTGRLLLDYLAQGIDTDGVDNSPEMLALCRAKAELAGLAPRVYQQEMEQLNLPRTYCTILIPSSSFQLLTAEGAPAAAMSALFRHLRPGGALVMPFMVEWVEGEPLENRTDWHEAVREDGSTVGRRFTIRRQPERQLESTITEFEVVVDGAVIQREQHERDPSLRWYSQEQVERLYGDAGFASVRLLHEFTHEPARPEDRLFTAVGEKPST